MNASSANNFNVAHFGKKSKKKFFKVCTCGRGKVMTIVALGTINSKLELHYPLNCYQTTVPNESFEEFQKNWSSLAACQGMPRQKVLLSHTVSRLVWPPFTTKIEKLTTLLKLRQKNFRFAVQRNCFRPTSWTAAGELSCNLCAVGPCDRPWPWSFNAVAMMSGFSNPQPRNSAVPPQKRHKPQHSVNAVVLFCANL